MNIQIGPQRLQPTLLQERMWPQSFSGPLSVQALGQIESGAHSAASARVAGSGLGVVDRHDRF